MADSSRREFLCRGAIGLSAGLSVLALRADAQPTPASGRPDDALALLQKEAGIPAAPAGKWEPTADNIPGRFHRPGAPFRAKVSPPLEPGDVLLISGRVWGFDTKKPLANAALDVWQANAKGRYDNDDPKNPPAKDVFKNRARLLTDENGYYEYETVRRSFHSTKRWRPSFITWPGAALRSSSRSHCGDLHNDKDDLSRPAHHRPKGGERRRVRAGV